MKNTTHTQFAGVFLACISLFLFICIFVPKTTFAFDGSGTEEDPYLITSCDDLQAIPDFVPEGEYYKLSGTDPIDCTATAGWNDTAGFDPIYNFAGDFDGNDMTIDGLTIDRPGSADVAL